MQQLRYLKEHAGRIGLTVLLFCLIVYTVYHAVGGSAGSLNTTPVRQVTDTTLVTGEGWLFRDETVLTVPEGGLINSLAASGTKVGRNTELFQAWYGTGIAEAVLAAEQLRLDSLNRQIALLEDSLLPEGTKLSAAAGYRSDAMKKLSEIRAGIRTGNWTGLKDAGDEMLISLNRYAALLSSEEGIRQTLAVLQDQRNAMLNGECRTTVNDSASGYYYDKSAVDGLESIFRTQELETLTGERFEQLKRAAPLSEDGLAGGKICYGYQWYLALTLPAELAEGLETGTAYTVKFPENRDRELRLTCTDLRDAGDGSGQTIVILRSDVTPADFSFLRCQTVELTMGESTGLYIPEQAIVHLGGEVGVYIFDSGTTVFRRIAPSAVRDGYYLCLAEDPEPEKETAYLKLNDLMVLSGKNLYDGKVYRQ